MKATTKEFIKLIKMNQKEAFDYVLEEVRKIKGTVVTVSKGEFIYVTTSALASHKPLLTSHLDTINDARSRKGKVNCTIEGNILSVSDGLSVLGADDRTGVWLMLQLLRDDDSRSSYDYVFCCDEEVGGLGSSSFSEKCEEDLHDYSCVISLDRAGVNDVATYGYDNPELVKVFTDVGFKETYGTFTDCVNISSVTEIACVNLSVGYFNEHTSTETQDISVMYSILSVLKDKKIQDKLLAKQYVAEYMPYRGYGKGYDYSGYTWDDDYDDYTVTYDNPVVCDCCQEHKPLYTKVVERHHYVLCGVCYDYY